MSVGRRKGNWLWCCLREAMGRGTGDTAPCASERLSPGQMRWLCLWGHPDSLGLSRVEKWGLQPDGPFQLLLLFLVPLSHLLSKGTKLKLGQGSPRQTSENEPSHDSHKRSSQSTNPKWKDWAASEVKVHRLVIKSACSITCQPFFLQHPHARIHISYFSHQPILAGSRSTQLCRHGGCRVRQEEGRTNPDTYL